MRIFSNAHAQVRNIQLQRRRGNQDNHRPISNLHTLQLMF